MIKYLNIWHQIFAESNNNPDCAGGLQSDLGNTVRLPLPQGTLPHHPHAHHHRHHHLDHNFWHYDQNCSPQCCDGLIKYIKECVRTAWGLTCQVCLSSFLSTSSTWSSWLWSSFHDLTWEETTPVKHHKYHPNLWWSRDNHWIGASRRISIVVICRRINFGRVEDLSEIFKAMFGLITWWPEITVLAGLIWLGGQVAIVMGWWWWWTILRLTHQLPPRAQGYILVLVLGQGLEA